MIAGLEDPNAYGVLYDIRNDVRLLSQICEASLSTGKLGLSIEHGLVGSLDWWTAVEAGKVAIVTFPGVIRQVDGGPMGDVATVRLEGNGEIKSWLAWEGFQASLVGQSVVVCYVCVRPKHPPRPDFLVELILQVRVMGKD